MFLKKKPPEPDDGPDSKPNQLKCKIFQSPKSINEKNHGKGDQREETKGDQIGE